MPFKVHRYHTVSSTNTMARSLVTSTAAEGLVVLAKSQTEGRGRRGREWVSQEGNIFCSIFFKPACDLNQLVVFSYISALSVALTLEQLLGKTASPTVKWPNDVLLEGKKVAGILLESINFEDNDLGMIVGIGMNVESAPQGVSQPATYLTSYQPTLTKGRVFTTLLRQLSEHYLSWKRNGFEGLRQEWLKRCVHLNQVIDVQAGQEKLRGKFLDIAPDGALRIEKDGSIVRLYAGELVE